MSDVHITAMYNGGVVKGAWDLAYDASQLTDEGPDSLWQVLREHGAVATQQSVAARTGITALEWRKEGAPRRGRDGYIRPDHDDEVTADGHGGGNSSKGKGDGKGGGKMGGGGPRTTPQHDKARRQRKAAGGKGGKGDGKGAGYGRR